MAPDRLSQLGTASWLAEFSTLLRTPRSVNPVEEPMNVSTATATAGLSNTMQLMDQATSSKKHNMFLAGLVNARYLVRHALAIYDLIVAESLDILFITELLTSSESNPDLAVACHVVIMSHTAPVYRIVEAGWHSFIVSC